jgi:hypothetical protein
MPAGERLVDLVLGIRERLLVGGLVRDATSFVGLVNFKIDLVVVCGVRGWEDWRTCLRGRAVFKMVRSRDFVRCTVSSSRQSSVVRGEEPVAWRTPGFVSSTLLVRVAQLAQADPGLRRAAASTLSRNAPESESSLRHVFSSPLPRRRMHPFGQGRHAPRISTRPAIGGSDQARSRPRPIGPTLLMQETCSKMLTNWGWERAKHGAAESKKCAGKLRGNTSENDRE